MRVVFEQIRSGGDRNFGYLLGDREARAAVLIGSERAGLSDELLAIATPVRIPMAPGVDSLNAAAATAVACFALRRR